MILTLMKPKQRTLQHLVSTTSYESKKQSDHSATSALFSPARSLSVLTFLLLNWISLELVAAPPTVPNIEEDKPVAKQRHFRPRGFTDKLMPYDLQKLCQVNREKAEAGKPSQYSYFIVREFSEHFYPKVEFQWHRAGDAFRHVGICKSGKETVQEVYLSWTSLSDGLQWGFFNDELQRTTKADPFEIIAETDVANAIKKKLFERKLIDELQDVTDVFSYRTRLFSTKQKTSKLTFPDKAFGETKYGISIGKKLYFFTAQGQEAIE